MQKVSGEFPAAADVSTCDACESERRCEDPGVTEQTLAHARAGDEAAFRELTDPYRRELQLHIYRIVGSPQDAEDLLQETLLAAWRGLEQFQERASVRSWLYRIATNRSLDALRASRRRPAGPQRRPRCPSRQAGASRCGCSHIPTRSSRGSRTRRPDRRRATRPRRRSRSRSSSACSISRRSSARCSCSATSSGTAPGGRRHARDQRGVGQQPAAPGAVGVRVPPSGDRARPGAAPRLQARARHRRPLRRERRERRRRRNGRAAHRRRVAHDAAPPPRLPGTRRDRRVPARGEERRGAPLRLRPTRANTQPAFGGYHSAPEPSSRVDSSC